MCHRGREKSRNVDGTKALKIDRELRAHGDQVAGDLIGERDKAKEIINDTTGKGWKGARRNDGSGRTRTRSDKAKGPGRTASSRNLGKIVKQFSSSGHG